MESKRSRWLKGSLLVIALVVSAQVNAQSASCGELSNNYGPFDYRFDRNKLPIVEQYHFTPQIEAFKPGTTSAPVEDDIGYTLRAFPNHARALAAVMRLAERQQSRHPPGLQYSIDCYFERAIRFRKDDHVVRMLYANWLGKTSRKDEALRQLSAVQAQDNPLTLNNLGLIYAELGDYDRALELAHQSLAMGYTRPTLPLMLQKLGKWREPAAPADAASAPLAASAAAPASAPALAPK